MQRSNLAPVILQLKALGIDNVLRFHFMSVSPTADSGAHVGTVEGHWSGMLSVFLTWLKHCMPLGPILGVGQTGIQVSQSSSSLAPVLSAWERQVSGELQDSSTRAQSQGRWGVRTSSVTGLAVEFQGWESSRFGRDPVAHGICDDFLRYPFHRSGIINLL